MSYDIYLNSPDGKRIEFDEPHHLTGGTYQLGGSQEAWLNVTYNYTKHFHRVLDPEKGIRWLYGKTVAETVPALTQAIWNLKDDLHDDYWAPTEGNARKALMDLVALALRVPRDSVWDGD